MALIARKLSFPWYVERGVHAILFMIAGSADFLWIFRVWNFVVVRLIYSNGDSIVIEYQFFKLRHV